MVKLGGNELHKNVSESYNLTIDVELRGSYLKPALIFMHYNNHH